MKKVLVFGMVFMALVAVGCGNNKKVDYEAVMKAQADAYYERYIKPGYVETGKGFDTFKAELSQMRNANLNAGAGLALDDLEKCSDSSYVDMKLNQETWAVSAYEYHLTCE